jgi:hypothetical protein
VVVGLSVIVACVSVSCARLYSLRLYSLRLHPLFQSTCVASVAFQASTLSEAPMANPVDRSTANPFVLVVSNASVAARTEYPLRSVEFVALGDAAANVLALLKTKVQASNRT